MASQKKPNGSTTVQRVEDARQKAGCDSWKQFFHVANHILDEPVEGFDPSREACLFERFKREGIVVHPRYTVPDCVLSLADMLHSATCPRKLYSDLRARVQNTAVNRAREAMAT